MKKILIVNKSFATGGIQSSMINMANELCDYYDVDLYLYHPEGPMKERLDPRVKVLTPSWRFSALGMSYRAALRSGNLKMMAFRFFATAVSRLFGNALPIALACRKEKKLAGYDLAIAYHHEQFKRVPNSGFVRFVDRCVEAKKKVAWIHYDPGSIELDREYNTPFYEKMDRIVCVSESLMNSFAEKHPTLAEKMEYCYNFMSYSKIIEKSLLSPPIEIPADRFALFSASRFTPEKAFPRAIEATKELFFRYPELTWYLAGDGPREEDVKAVISAAGLEDRIVLIGNQPNPYPFMKRADLVLNVSYHEAAPMVFFESLAIGTPVFATKTSSAEEMLFDGENAFLCENSEEGIFTLLSHLLEHKEKIVKAKSNLESYRATNEKSLQKIKDLMEL